VPYNAVVVQLEEGPYMVTNLINCEPSAIAIGLPVEVALTRIDEGLTLPYFQPAEKP